MSLLKTEEIRKSYKGRTVADGVSIQVDAGKIVGLLGPNGAGKTTTFYMVVGLVEADAGKIFFDGQDVTSLPMYKRARLGMGYLAQEPSIFRRLTVEANLLAILETLDISGAERKLRARDLLDELGLGNVAKQLAITLSGGERRRLEIARALVTSPRFLMLDEPFAAIDPKAVQDVQDIIRRLRDRGIAILITDHSVRETLAVVDHAYIMNAGKILCEGSRDFLINDQKARDIYLGPAFEI